MKVDWTPYSPGQEVPVSPSGYYWIALRDYQAPFIGTREYSKHSPSLYVWRCEDLGGVDDLVTHFARMEWPELPRDLPPSCTVIGDGYCTTHKQAVILCRPNQEATMGWSIGFDDNWNRDIGYGVPALCDHPGCGAHINRGLGYVCAKGEPFGGEEGCGLFFCEKHRDGEGFCERCGTTNEGPFEPSPDTIEWLTHKLTHESWGQWRDENPDEVAKIKKTVADVVTGAALIPCPHPSIAIINTQEGIPYCSCCGKAAAYPFCRQPSRCIEAGRCISDPCCAD